jgi:hypothetical protein
MPTTLPRVNVPFERATYEALAEISKVKHESLSRVVANLVKYALELAEDLALAKCAEARLRTFNRSDAMTSDQVLKWNKARKKR